MKARMRVLIFLSAALCGFSEPVLCDSCSVPGTHPSIQSAVDDLGCSDIQLFNRQYFGQLIIDRSLSLAGPPGGTARVIGQVSVTGGTTMAILSDFGIESGCSGGALRVFGGAASSVSGMRVAQDSSEPCQINVFYSDGFEGGL